MVRCRFVEMDGPGGTSGNEHELGWATWPLPPQGTIKIGEQLYQLVGYRFEADSLSQNLEEAPNEGWMMVSVRPYTPSSIVAPSPGTIGILAGKKN